MQSRSNGNEHYLSLCPLDRPRCVPWTSEANRSFFFFLLSSSWTSIRPIVNCLSSILRHWNHSPRLRFMCARYRVIDQSILSYMWVLSPEGIVSNENHKWEGTVLPYKRLLRYRRLGCKPPWHERNKVKPPFLPLPHVLEYSSHSPSSHVKLFLSGCHTDNTVQRR